MVVELYNLLFTAKPISYDKAVIPNLFPSLADRDTMFLCRNVDDLEFKKALFMLENIWSRWIFTCFLSELLGSFWRLDFWLGEQGV